MWLVNHLMGYEPWRTSILCMLSPSNQDSALLLWLLQHKPKGTTDDGLVFHLRVWDQRPGHWKQIKRRQPGLKPLATSTVERNFANHRASVGFYRGG